MISFWWHSTPIESRQRRRKKYGSTSLYHVWSRREGITTIHRAKENRKHHSPIGRRSRGFWRWRRDERQDTHGTIGIQSKRIPKCNAYKRKRKNTRQLLNEY